jgi:AcrR family transcriptional regulator
MTAATKKRLRPRKMPTQDRARETVRAILEAAAYILARDGWAKATTNHIAERAGVNIASLYQYFPSKEAIAVELQRQHRDRLLEGQRRVAPPARSRSLRSMLTERVEAAVTEHRRAPSLHKALGDELARSAVRAGAGEDVKTTVEQWRATASPLFRNVPDPDLAELIARTAVYAVLHEAASERPGLLNHPLLVSEVVTLLERYLRRPRSRPTGR